MDTYIILIISSIQYMCVFIHSDLHPYVEKNLFPLKNPFLSSYFLHPSETMVDI